MKAALLSKQGEYNAWNEDEPDNQTDDTSPDVSRFQHRLLAVQAACSHLYAESTDLYLSADSHSVTYI